MKNPRHERQYSLAEATLSSESLCLAPNLGQPFWWDETLINSIGIEWKLANAEPGISA